jgi:hypothetical protein
MKPWLLITGIFTILLLLGIWLYLLFFGAPNTDDLFGGFNFGDTTEEIIPLPPVSPEAVENAPPARLRQLTTRAVTGYTESLATSTANPEVLFVEGGTGHVYRLDVVTGEETRVSNITIAGATVAVFSPDQTRVVIQSGFGQNRTLQSISLVDTTATDLPSSVGTFAFNQSGELLYASSNNTVVVAKTYNFTTNTSRDLFTVPFREVTIDWGTEPDAAHYFYPKSASRLEGALYTGTNAGAINRTPLSGYGLSAVTNPFFTVFAIQVDSSYQTYIYNQFEQTSVLLGAGFLPEKCAFLNQIQAYTICAQSSFGTYDLSIPDQWYMGAVSFTDELWLTNLTNSETILLTETAVTTGRELDIVSLQTNNTDERLYFINKNDQALWLYELVE